MYNMLERTIERDVLPYCRAAGIAVFPYSTLAHGLLTAKAKYADDHRFGERDTLLTRTLTPEEAA